ncbi:MAG: hypothetical protein CSYNP_04136 [Syntrophus sp. SKADARSKE-3]|nr:hypothetical protein [Syntrophus sp. SKADARSKE-3]
MLRISFRKMFEAASVNRKRKAINGILSILAALIIFSLTGCGLFRDYANISMSNSYDKAKNKVGVLPFVISGGKGELDYFTSDYVTMQLIRIGFKVVEKQQLVSVLNELKVENYGSMSRQDMSEIKKLADIDMIVFGTIYNVTGRQSYSYINGISLRFVDLTTGEVVLVAASDEVRGDVQWYVNHIANRIEETMKTSPQKKL